MQINPILYRELQSRSRRVGTTVSLTLFLLLMAVVGAVVWAAENIDDSYGPVTTAARLGRNLFEWIVLSQVILLSLIIPGTTGGTITGERDRQTLVPIQVSLLRPRHIVTGKLLASLAYTALLVVTGLPLYAIAYTLGGVGTLEPFAAAFGLVLHALILGSLSVCCSTLFRRTAPAMVLSYLCMLALLIGTLLLTGLSQVFRPDNEWWWFLVLNPVVIVGTVLRSVSDVSVFTAPMTSAGETSSWWGSILVTVIVCTLSLSIAVRRLRTPTQKDR
jgi:ABC-2 type transport system permease protein